MGNFIKKLIPANIASIIGFAQVLVPLTRELLITLVRIVDVLTPKTGLEPIIVKIVSVSAAIENIINKFKNMFLGV